MQITIIAYYYPPINSSGAKRAEALSKYFIGFGHGVTVITPQKKSIDGKFSEDIPSGVNLIELNWSGLERPSVDSGGQFEPLYTSKPSLSRRFKNLVMHILGQIPDPRLPFAFSFLMPWFSSRAKKAIFNSDVVIGTTPPWSMILAAVFCKIRFDKPCILDYRDHFSECHEMPGGRFAKSLEKIIDRMILKKADHVVCISEPMSSYYRSMHSDVDTILNGYDHELINKARLSASLTYDDEFIRIRYMGSVSPGRVPHNILNALILLKSNASHLFRRLRFEFYGNGAVMENCLKERYSEISEIFYFFAPVSYSSSLTKIVEADYLLFSETSTQKTLSAQGILTTKLFEYLGSGRPIVGDISPSTLAGKLAVDCDSRHIIGNDIKVFYSAFVDDKFYVRKPDFASSKLLSISRKSQAQQYLDVIAKLVEKNH